MDNRLNIEFAPLSAAPTGPVVVLAVDGAALGTTARGIDSKAGGALGRAATAAGFTGKRKSAIEVLGVPELASGRVIVAGAGGSDLDELGRITLGGFILAQIAARKAATASVIAELPGNGHGAAETIAADIAYGALLRSYAFTKYRTRTGDAGKEDGEPKGLERLVIHTAKHEAAAAQFRQRAAVAQGVFLARDLVNEPANALGPVEFAERIRALSESGLEVEILDEVQLEELKMGALLAVGQGSTRPSRVAVMQWHGAKSKRTKPVAFIGKGVVFDTGGISMKPAAGMEDMKGDMGGAACVCGLMLALAGRKAPVNAVGLVGLVENMPSGNAQRPGDIVTSMSGQTIEVLNTDAEGRLVLADLLWYAQERFKPRLMVDLATLTGAIMVALGKENAGLFSNDDKLAQDILAAGEATGETSWRMPLGKAYDKLIDSKTADMKNIGGRFGGAITAAQFLQRFVRETPWAHLDVAGTAMDSQRNDINQSWGSGWGVRMLDRMVADAYEKAEK